MMISNQFYVSAPKSHGRDMEDPAKSPDRADDWKSSARSLPLLKDDDYFYYHGADLDRDEKVNIRDSDDGDEPVDHVGALIGPSFSTPMMVPTKNQEERDLKNSFQSQDLKLKNSFQSQQPSEITCDDWSVDLSECDRGGPKIEKGCDELCVEEFIGLKVRVAELESQLQLQRQNDSLERKVQDLQNRNLSLECENIGLKQMLQESVKKLKQMPQRVQEEIASEREAAQIVQDFMQEKITNMENEIDEIKRKNEALQAENRRLRYQRQDCLNDSPSSSGRFSASDMESSHREGETDDLDSSIAVRYLPFPRQPRRASAGARYANPTGSGPSSRETRPTAERPSLLEALRSHIASTSNLRSRSPGLLESSDGSRATRTTADVTLPSSDASQLYETWGHASWASTDAINDQTKLFNRQSSARLLTKIKDDAEREEDSCAESHSDGDAIPRRHQLRRSKSDKIVSTPIDAPSHPVPKPKQNRYFHLSRMGSNFSLLGNDRDEKEFDAKKELWDTSSRSSRDGEEEDGTIATRHSRFTARF